MERQALLLAGGGARAAYQVGCLRYIARALPDYRPQILTGVSAGAINAVHLASFRGPFAGAVEKLRELWLGLDTERVYHTELRYLLAHILGAALPLFSAGRLGGGSQFRGMVSTEPLQQFLREHLNLAGDRILGIRENIDEGMLEALAIMTTNYDSGRSTAWVESAADDLWQRGQQQAAYVDMTLQHVLASSALPLFFPAVELGNSWHGDGGVRLTAPLSPALHLGATRILAVSPRSRPFAGTNMKAAMSIGTYPSPAQVAGVMLNAVFLDMLDFDALQMSRINRLLHALEPEKRNGMRPVEVMVLRPSRDIGRLAADNEFRLPKAFRFFERGVSGGGVRNADALSMVNFEPEYLALLMELGEEDASKRGEEIEAFLLAGACAVPVW